jgi:peroxin-5
MMPTNQHQHQISMMHHQHQYAMAHHVAAFQQQQQQQHIMHHQMQIMVAQNNQAMQNRKQRAQRTLHVHNPLQDDLRQNSYNQEAYGLDGALQGASIEELTAAWKEAIQDGDIVGHDGVVHGASVEELAAAWAEAENDDQNFLVNDGVANGASIEELAAAWAQAEAEYEKLTEPEQLDYDPANMYQGDAHMQPYEFINKLEDNQAAQDRDWIDEGMRQFRTGNLKEAIRSFEMELQQHDPHNATAWKMLGKCHAENDMDPEAIKCLEAAVDHDPYSPETLLALGSSYVNELNHERALENMKAWFTHNPKYAGLELPSDIYGDGESVEKTSAFEEVKQLLVSALAFDASDAGDVHEALGVVYNVIKDYDAAAASLRKALETRPEDYQLWNKLGATLANGSRSDQALPAYHRALQIKPKYARAWLNMAISHSNLEDHNEAARCYLQTLSLNPGAKHCWAYLRMALSSAERWDLLPLCFGQDLKAFQEHFDFIYEE